MPHFTQFAKDCSGNNMPEPREYSVYPGSVHPVNGGVLCMADGGAEDLLVTDAPGTLTGESAEGLVLAPLTHENARALRELFPFTAPSKVLSRDRTFGAGDRLGIAGPGHLRVFESCAVTPVLAQQSVRELNLTNRTFQDIVDAATFATYRAGFERGYGADGDHVKTMHDIQAALDAGCTMITLDCSDYINKPASLTADPDIEPLYLNRTFRVEDEVIRFSAGDLAESLAIYSAALAFTKEVHDAFFGSAAPQAELELSIDETQQPTTPLQHFFFASELRRHGIDIATLAPRFAGEFQKGVDYIGDLGAFERDFRVHAAIARHFGHKLSIHSGSDKFSIFPVIAKYAGDRYHLKTAGTSWLEAMRIVAAADPCLYREAHSFALESFDGARAYYHVSAEASNIPRLDSLADSELPALLDLSDARQLIHITYGFILGDAGLKRRLYELWRRERQAYSDALFAHIGRHIGAFDQTCK
ncbi:MAG: tagaturonate epimerase family protein [Oscillospiraceae bacterium]|nr:tagaturonate epimerase family protein [Oscillospiraceae bacterium]